MRRALVVAIPLIILVALVVDLLGGIGRESHVLEAFALLTGRASGEPIEELADASGQYALHLPAGDWRAVRQRHPEPGVLAQARDRTSGADITILSRYESHAAFLHEKHGASIEPWLTERGLFIDTESPLLTEFAKGALLRAATEDRRTNAVVAVFAKSNRLFAVLASGPRPSFQPPDDGWVDAVTSLTQRPVRRPRLHLPADVPPQAVSVERASGFPIGQTKDGCLIVTSSAWVHGDIPVRLQGAAAQREDIRAKVLARDEAAGLALLASPPPCLEAVRWRTSGRVLPGEPLFAFGARASPKVSRAVTSAGQTEIVTQPATVVRSIESGRAIELARPEELADLLSAELWLSGEYVGGPITDESLRVVAMATAPRDAWYQFAIPAETILDFLRVHLPSWTPREGPSRSYLMESELPSELERQRLLDSTVVVRFGESSMLGAVVAATERHLLVVTGVSTRQDGGLMVIAPGPKRALGEVLRVDARLGLQLIQIERSADLPAPIALDRSGLELYDGVALAAASYPRGSGIAVPPLPPVIVEGDVAEFPRRPDARIIEVAEPVLLYGPFAGKGGGLAGFAAPLPGESRQREGGVARYDRMSFVAADEIASLLEPMVQRGSIRYRLDEARRCLIEWSLEVFDPFERVTGATIHLGREGMTPTTMAAEWVEGTGLGLRHAMASGTFARCDDGTVPLTVELQRSGGAIQWATWMPPIEPSGEMAEARLPSPPLPADTRPAPSSFEMVEACGSQGCRAACLAGDSDACTRIGLPPPSAGATLASLRQACDRRDPVACRRAAHRLVATDGVEAQRLYRRGCDEDDAPSCFWSGGFRYWMHDSPMERTVSLESFERSCELGEPYGCHAAAIVGIEGHAPADALQAQLVRACSQGVIGGCWGLSSLLQRQPDRGGSQALEAFEMACSWGDPKACADLGRHRKGEIPTPGTSEDGRWGVTATVSLSGHPPPWQREFGQKAKRWLEVCGGWNRHRTWKPRAPVGSRAELRVDLEDGRIVGSELLRSTAALDLWPRCLQLPAGFQVADQLGKDSVVLSLAVR